MQQVLYTRDAVRQTTEGGFHRVFRKNVSYNKYEDHIQKIEKELVKKADNAKNKNILYEAEVIFQQLIEDCN